MTVTRLGVFRPAPGPRVPLPFGVRSAGRHAVAAAGTMDDQLPRPILQLYWCVRGEARFTRADGVAVVRPGQVFVYRPGEPHRIAAGPDGADCWWLTIDGPLAGAVMDAFALVPPWPRTAGPAPEALFQRLLQRLDDPSPHAERGAADAGWAVLAAAAAGAGGRTDPDEPAEALRRLLVERQADPDCSVEALCRELGRDRSALSRRFTAAFGTAPKPYLLALRLQRAMALLRSGDQPVAAVARAAGFADPGYFTRAFHRAIGSPPHVFREHG